jgi:hypothetical protein
MFATKKAFMMFDLKRDNKVVAFVKRNRMLFTLVTGIAIGVFALPDAHAAGLGALSNKTKQNLDEVCKYLIVTGGAACVVRVIMVGIKVSMGLDEWHGVVNSLGKVGFGGLLIAGSAILSKFIIPNL